MTETSDPTVASVSPVVSPDDVLTSSTSLARLRFDNRFTAELPADQVTGPSVRSVTAAFSRVRPVVVPGPRIVAWSAEVSDQLGLDEDVWSHPDAAQVFTGSRLLPGSDPFAANYGGHQFGNWAGQLGDGRAIALGEVVDVNGDHQTLQLKGAGPTPYSRRADGLAVLRSSIREFLCSEAMHHLGVPTTRALSLALTGNQVVRDMFYDGNPRPEPGAIVCRVAPSFIRFGNFQIFAARQDHDTLRALADFTVRHYEPDLMPDDGQPTAETYRRWFARVCRTTCDLVVDWMRIGFVHGVMNTDNMSIHGLTIDYGPYGWIDDYDPDWTPNTTDAGGRRYRFGHQPHVAHWNLIQLAQALFPLIGEPEPLQEALNDYVDRYHAGYRSMMVAKLGLVPASADADDDLVAGLDEALRSTEIDMTIFFRRLWRVAGPDDVWTDDGLGPAFYDRDAVGDEARDVIVGWFDRYLDRVAGDGRTAEERRESMDAVNPKYVLPQLPGPAGHRRRGGRRPRRGPDAARGRPTALRRAPGVRALRRPSPRLGPRPTGFVDALLLELSPPSRSSCTPSGVLGPRHLGARGRCAQRCVAAGRTTHVIGPT